MKRNMLTILALLLISFTSLFSGEIDIKKLPKLLTSPTNAGTDFYFSFPPCYEEESAGWQNSCRVFVCSGVNQLITLEVASSNFKQTKMAIANDAVEFTIPTNVAQPFLKTGQAFPPSDKVYLGAAVHVYSKSPIIVYGVTRYNYTSDGFLAVPVSALGKEYIVASYPQYTALGASYQLNAETTISAAYDETVVEFEMGGNSLSVTGGGLKPGDKATFNMKRGDVLCFSSSGDVQDISGSYIKATKPVAVVSGNQCANVPAGVYACDYMSEMELPIYTWGKEYHVTPFYGRRNNPVVRIYAKERNTTVYRDGQPWMVIVKNTCKLDDGYIERRSSEGAPRAVVISANKPIYVVEYNPGQSDDNIQSDPFQLVLTPLEQYQTEIVFCTPGSKGGSNNFKLHYVNLVYELSSSGTIPDDAEIATVINGKFDWKKINSRFGNNPGLIFQAPVNGKTYACKQITLAGDGVYRIRAKSKFAAYAYGFSNYDSYGFPTSIALGNLLQKDSIAPKPTFTLNCDGSVLDGIVRDLPEDNTVRVNFGTIYMDTDSSHNYEFEYDLQNILVSGETQQTDWTLKVIDESKPAKALIWFIDRNGNDTSITIKYNPIDFSVLPSNKLDFKLIKNGYTKLDSLIIVNNSIDTIKIESLYLKDNTQGFKFLNLNLPVILGSKDSLVLLISFTNNIDGNFTDEIIYRDTCEIISLAKLFGEVASPIIEVEDFNYGTRPVGSNTSWNQLLVKNVGRVDLILYGDNSLNALISTSEFKTVNWNLKYPIIIKPKQNISLQVDFNPITPGFSTAKIEFSNDALTKDSICILKGNAVEPGLIASSLDWKRKRIQNAYLDSIYLENSGTSPVTIRQANWLISSDSLEYTIDLLQFINKTINPGERKYFPIYFTPIIAGTYHAEINFTTFSNNVNASSTLDGIGIIGKLKTTDLTFDTTFIDKNISSKRQFYIECLNWQYEDSVTLKDILVSKGFVTEDITQPYSTDGYRYNKAEANLQTILQPGQKLLFIDSVEFLAKYVNPAVVSLTTNSDADSEVTSTWTGNGKVSFIPNPQVSFVLDSIQNCVGQSATFNILINSIGNFPYLIDSITIEQNNQFSLSTVYSNMTVIQNSQPLPINIVFTPNITGKSKANLHIYSYGKDSVIEINSTGTQYSNNIILGEIDENQNDIVRFNSDAGSEIKLHLILKDSLQSNTKALSVTLTFNKRLISIVQSKLLTYNDLVLKNYKEVSNSIITTITFDLENENAFIIDKGKLIDIIFAVYLPSGEASTPITVEVKAINNQCQAFNTKTTFAVINPTCAFNIRKVDGSNVSYSMSKIIPNIITDENITVDFSIGLESSTKFKIYNSQGFEILNNNLGVLNRGIYNMTINSRDLSSGLYFIKMESGQFITEQKIIIVK